MMILMLMVVMMVTLLRDFNMCKSMGWFQLNNIPIDLSWVIHLNVMNKLLKRLIKHTKYQGLRNYQREIAKLFKTN